MKLAFTILFALLLMLGCGPKIPIGTADILTFSSHMDSLFVSPVVAEPDVGINFTIVEMPKRSQGTAARYLNVWREFIVSRGEREGLKVILPQLDAQKAKALFNCPMSDSDWISIYGVVPGAASRVLIVEEMKLHGIKHSWLSGVTDRLNLVDTYGREWGWLELHYSIFDFLSDTGSGNRLLVSREPDRDFTPNHVDRAGRLMVRSATDIVREVKR
jgi:hypothetical protein